jgi:hypothetical protein
VDAVERATEEASFMAVQSALIPGREQLFCFHEPADIASACAYAARPLREIVKQRECA